VIKLRYFQLIQPQSLGAYMVVLTTLIYY